MKVRCVKLLDSGGKEVARSPWIDMGRVYHVLSMSIGGGYTSLRIVGREAETPALFRLEMFEVVSSKIPVLWQVSSRLAGHLSIGPPEWDGGFWESFYNRDPDSAACFERIRAQIVAEDP